MIRHAACLLVVVLCALLAGCSAQANGSGGAGVRPKAASAASASPAPGQRVPVLGESRADTRGYGLVRPGTLNNGGDPTGIVTNLLWHSWGGPEAVGTGTGFYDPPNVPVAQATAEQATVVAFDLGTCAGKYMYEAVEWYFPESGGSFDSGTYLDVCTWTYHTAGG